MQRAHPDNVDSPNEHYNEKSKQQLLVNDDILNDNLSTIIIISG